MVKREVGLTGDALQYEVVSQEIEGAGLYVTVLWAYAMGRKQGVAIGAAAMGALSALAALAYFFWGG